MNRAVFLDRDGVLTRSLWRQGKPVAPVSLAEFELIPGVIEAAESLRRLGFRLIVVTNQPDVGAGRIDPAVLEQMHKRLEAALPLDEVFVCCHQEGDGCSCRKPKPGMLLEAARKWSIDLTTSYMIGDRWRDVSAGRAAGCKTILIDYAYDETLVHQPDFRVNSLADAAALIRRAEMNARSSMPSLTDLRVKIFADGADLKVIAGLARNPLIRGFTTNPTLMRKAGIRDYRAFALEVLQVVGNFPISFEVFSDEFREMERQALEIASWGKNVFVKIPVTNTRAEFAGELIARLAKAGVQLNVTALLTIAQVQDVLSCLSPEVSSFVSVFAGRIADTGRDPVPLMAEAVQLLKSNPRAELIWASPRELLNIFHADTVGCQVITVTADILQKLPMVGKNLEEYSLDTVKMFYRDAVAADFRIETT